MNQANRGAFLNVYRFVKKTENKKKGTITGVYRSAGLVACDLIRNETEEEIKRILESSHGPLFKIGYPPDWKGPKPFEMQGMTYQEIKSDENG